MSGLLSRIQAKRIELTRQVTASYPDGCPDCGEPLPPMVLPGECCANCEHVFALPTPDDLP